ncbi:MULTISPECIES: LysR family transcriptional regulator [unclassified Salinibacterium]|uniref:LysR family transcriptional regulator n=1 Tax=unclassified Salinibacterium TaxID=2632331 RepID=UPI00141DAC75|nr:MULTISPECIES: LysR family transcriptional regulator [unclassified Salinibacterium]
MELTDLRRFTVVAEQSSFAQAAQALQLPPSTLGASIAKLEREVGAPLFDREGGTLRLTDDGTALLATAKRRLAAASGRGKADPVNTGGKAKASKGKGRAPEVKGQPKPGKRRQSR